MKGEISNAFIFNMCFCFFFIVKVKGYFIALCINQCVPLKVLDWVTIQQLGRFTRSTLDSSTFIKIPQMTNDVGFEMDSLVF